MSRRRWLIPLAALAVAIAPALASTAASASTHSSGALAIQNGGTAQHVIKPGTAALGAHSGLRVEAGGVLRVDELADRVGQVPVAGQLEPSCLRKGMMKRKFKSGSGSFSPT